MNFIKIKIFVIMIGVLCGSAQAQNAECIDYSDIKAAMIYNNVMKSFIDADENMLNELKIAKIECSYKDGRKVSETNYKSGKISGEITYNYRGEPEINKIIERDSLKRIAKIVMTDLKRNSPAITYEFDYSSDYITEITVRSGINIIEQAAFTSMPAEAYRKDSHIILADKYNFVSIKDSVNTSSKQNRYYEYFVDAAGRITLVKDIVTGTTLDSLVYAEDKTYIIQPETSRTEYRTENNRITNTIKRTKGTYTHGSKSKRLPPDIIDKKRFYIGSNGLIEKAHDGYDEIIYTYYNDK